MSSPGPAKVIDLSGAARERAVSVVIDSFVGVYRWHARRTLRDVSTVRAAEIDGELAGVSMLERLAPAVGYVYYLAVRPTFRRHGIGGLLLDDALAGFLRDGMRVVYAAAEEENRSSITLFLSRDFRAVERRERGYREGGLGAWGLRSRMWIVPGEVLLGRRFAPEPIGESPPGPFDRPRLDEAIPETGLAARVTPATSARVVPTISLGRLPFDLDAASLRSRADEVLGEAGRQITALEASPAPPTVPTLAGPINEILTRVTDVGAHGGLMFSVHPDAATRTAGREVSEAADRFFNAYRLNATLYDRLKSIRLNGEEAPTQFAIAKMLRDMRRAGVEKDPPTRARLLELNNTIDRVANQFSENIAKLERSIEVDAPAELSGLPPDYIQAHPPDGQGKVRLTTNYPDFFPVMAFCDRADVRRRLLFEFLNRASPENLPVLDELLSLRRQFAELLGYSSYAAYALEDKMMGNPAAARAFLERLGALLATPARADLRRYFGRKRRDHPDVARLELWDAEFFGRGYYDGKIRAEEFGVDTKLLRAYLPYPRVRDGLFALCRELFDITFTRAPGAEVWHPSVEAYDVARAGVPLGRSYLDLVPREGKFNHAACFAVREGVEGIQLPQSALICNFLDPSVPAETARMSWEDVITFFHEFGHLLHALLAGHTRWLFNGQSHVEWDFIEAPSQLFEEWARDPITLSHFARNPDTGEGIPEDLLRRLKGAESLGRPSRMLRQVALSSVSLELYDRDPRGVDTSEAFGRAWDRYYPEPIPKEYHPQAGFGHLTGYSAFYYTYLWSIVIARDLLSPFYREGTLTDPKIADRYAREILASGSTRPAADLIRAYLGREFNFDAFERWVREASPLDGPAGSTVEP